MMTDVELARAIAETAGRLLITLRDSRLFEGKALGRAGDDVANRFIMQALAEARPDDAVLSEEEVDNLARCDRSRVWIIDPLDGTREYGEGRADWAVHVALAVDGRPALGAVALPAMDLTLCSAALTPLADARATPRMVVSRTRPPAEALAVAERLGAELLPMGSAGAKAMAVVRGEAEIYLHSGGQYEWDNCAPLAVAAAHGLHVSRIDGSAPLYNRANPYVPDLLICRQEYAGTVLGLVAAMAAVQAK